MLVQEEVISGISTFLKHPIKKVLLITSEGKENILEIIIQKFHNDVSNCLIIDIAKIDNISQISFELSTIIVLVGFAANRKLENIYVKYQLDRYLNKIIVICDKSLIHPTLDASLYFAPIKAQRVQKHLFSKITLSELPRIATIITPTLELRSNESQRKVCEEALSLRRHFLNQKLMTQDLSMMHMLADRAIRDENFKTFLFKLIFASRNDKEVVIAAANAITVLNYARVAFSGMDLSNIKIPGADLYQANLDHTNLTSAMLENVRLQDSWLRGTNLTAANLLGVMFNEYPYFKHNREIKDVAFSPNGQWLAVCAGYNVCLWDFKLSKLQYILEGHMQRVVKVVFSFNSQMLATSSSDSTVKLWETSNGQELKTLIGHTKEVNSIAFSHDDETLASGSYDKTIRLWEVKSGKLLNIFEKYTNSVNLVTFNLQNILILSSCNEDGTVELWEIKNDRKRCTLKAHTQRVDCIAFCSDGNTIATGSHDHTVRLWDFNNGTLIHTLVGHTAQVYSIVFSPDGRTLVTGGLDNIAYLWNVKDGKVLDILEGNRSAINSIAYHPNGHILAFDDSQGQVVRFWNIKDRLSMQTDNNHVHGIKSVVFNPNSQILVSGSDDGSIRQWKAKNGQALGVPILAMNIIKIAYASSGEMFILYSTNKTLILKGMNNKGMHILNNEKIHVCSAAFSSDCKTIALGDWDKTISIWDVKSGDMHGPFVSHDVNSVRSIALSANGELLASGGDDKKVCVWDVKNQKKIHTFPGHCGEESIAFSLDGQFLAVGCVAGGKVQVHLWEIKTQKVVRIFKGPKETDRTCGLAFSVDGQFLACGNGNRTVWIWDAYSGQFLAELGGYWGLVRRLAWNTQGFLATGSDDHAIKYWQITRKTDKSLHCVLQWRTHAIMFAEGCLLSNTKLSALNARLLQQRGSIVNPATNEEELHIGNDISNADFPIENISSLAILDKAINEDDLETLQQLFQAGIDFNAEDDGDDYEDGEPRHIRNATALHTAAAVGNSRIVDWLLNHGADPSLRDKLGNETPAQWARHNGHNDVAVLIEKRQETFIVKPEKTDGDNNEKKHNKVDQERKEFEFLVLGERDEKTGLTHTHNKLLSSLGSSGIDSVHIGRPITKTQLGNLASRLLTLNKEKMLKVVNDSAKCLACSNNGKWIAVGIGNQIEVRENGDSKVGFVLKSHVNTVNCLIFSYDNKFLVSGSSDCTIKLWALPNFELKTTLEGHQKDILAISINHLNTLLASCSLDGTIKIWSLPQGSFGFTINNGSTNFTSLCFSPTEHLLAVCDNDGDLSVFDNMTSEKPATINTRTLQFENTRFTCVKFDCTGKVIAAGTRDGRVALWDFAAKQEDKQLYTVPRTEGQVNCVRFTFDNKAILYIIEGVIYFSLMEKKIHGRIHASHVRSVVDIQFLSENVSVSVNHAGKIYYDSCDFEFLDKKLDMRSPASSSLMKPQFTPVLSRPESLSADKQISVSINKKEVVDLKQMITTELCLPKEFNPLELGLKCIAFSPDGKWMAIGIGNLIYIKEKKGGIKSILKGQADTINCLVFSPNNQVLASGSKDKTIKLWDVPSFVLKTTLEGHCESILSISINQYSSLIASSSEDDTVMMWRIHAGNRGCVIDDYVTKVTGLCFSPVENLLVSADRDGNLCIWIGGIVLSSIDIEPNMRVKFENTKFTCARFSLDGKIIMAGTEDGCIIVWDFKKNQQDKSITTITNVEEPINCLQITADNKLVIYSTGSAINFQSMEDETAGSISTEHRAPIVDLQCRPDDTVVSTSIDGVICFNKLNQRFVIEMNEILKRYQLQKESSLPNLDVALRRAARCGPKEDVEFLIQFVKDIDATDTNPKMSRTALHWAIIDGKKANADVLIAAGAQSNIEDAMKKTAKDYASESTIVAIKTIFELSVAAVQSVIKDVEDHSYPSGVRM